MDRRASETRPFPRTDGATPVSGDVLGARNCGSALLPKARMQLTLRVAMEVGKTCYMSKPTRGGVGQAPGRFEEDSIPNK